MPWPSSAALLAPLAPWFDQVRRNLPWRATALDLPHPDPYAVLVSELMLQQTQVATVMPYFTRWMAQFPTAGALAGADEDVVHKAWEGLGYYRRARFLKAAAGNIAAEGWPTTLEGLAALPGLGPYSAAAVGAIAFQWPTPALDGNALRVLARLLLLEGDPKMEQAALRGWLVEALRHHGASRMTQALMELGATCCSPKPDCRACPLAGSCAAQLAGRTGEIPPVVRRAQPKASALWLVAFEGEGHLLLHRPAAKGLLAGLWRWPALEVDQFPAEVLDPVASGVRAWPGWTQVYTHRREAVRPLHLPVPVRFPAGDGLQWVPRAELGSLPLGRRDQRLRDLLATAGEVPLEAPILGAVMKACAAPWQ